MKGRYMVKTNIAVFASGRGSNFLAIVKAIKSGKIKNTNIAFLLSDNPNAPVVFKAKKLKIRTALVSKDIFPDKHDFEEKVSGYLGHGFRENRYRFDAGSENTRFRVDDPDLSGLTVTDPYIFTVEVQPFVIPFRKLYGPQHFNGYDLI